ncbi:hypothetical protein GCM10022290_25380 [Sagittula marina]
MADLNPGDMVELTSGAALARIWIVRPVAARFAAQTVRFHSAAPEVGRAIVAVDALRKVDA